jgi:dTDP-glucose pyrophosphorylase
MNSYSNHLINEKAEIKLAFEKLNHVPKNLTLFVINSENRMVGTLTDGDIRRGFLRGLQLSDLVENFMITNFRYLNDSKISPDEIKIIKDLGIKLLPVLDSTGCIIRVVDLNKTTTILPLDAVLMAGGRGERLRPLTDNIPKPLLKIGNKPIIEHVLNHLTLFGIRNYHIAIRYLGEQIEEYLGNGAERDIKIEYLREDRIRGTIGPVSSIKSFSNESVLVMNADLFTNIDLEEFYRVFNGTNADMAIATVPYTVDIPYAVMSFDKLNITGLKEKPSYTYHSNAGIYIINKKLFKLIPGEEFFNATDFIQKVIENGMKVIRFPITGFWFDIGKPEDYYKVQDIASHIIK